MNILALYAHTIRFLLFLTPGWMEERKKVLHDDGEVDIITKAIRK